MTPRKTVPLIATVVWATSSMPAMAQSAPGSGGDLLFQLLPYALIGGVIWYLAKRGKAATAKGTAATAEVKKPGMKLTGSHMIMAGMAAVIVWLLLADQQGPTQTSRSTPPPPTLDDVHRAVSFSRGATITWGPVSRDTNGQFWTRCSLVGMMGPATFARLVHTSMGWQQQRE